MKKKSFTKYLANRAALLLSAALLLTGCSSAPAQNGETPSDSAATVADSTVETQETKETMPEITDGNYPAQPGYVKVLGRYQFWQDVLWLSLSGTGVEFEVTGTTCQVSLVGDSTAAVDTMKDHQARYAVYLDDERVAEGLLDEKEKNITVFEGSDTKTGIVRVVKLSESADSSYGISNIYTDGTLKPTPDSDLKIEFIGDSITCAYGVDDPLGGVYSTNNEDETKSYAYLTAKALGADYSMVSYSGYGIVSGYTGDGTINTASLMPTYYDKLGNSYGTILNGLKTSTLKWDFTKFQPDVVVINLGTNDHSYCGTDETRCQEYETAYVAFLKTVRAANPDATIVATLGIMGDELYPYIEQAVSAYTDETGDSNISSMKFDVQSADDGYAVDYHPTPATHEKAAEKLSSYLTTLLGL